MPLLDKEEMQVWEQRIVRAHRAKKEHVRRWNKIRDYYEGLYHAFQVEGDQYSVNWMQSQVRNMKAQLYFQPPAVNARPLSQVGNMIAPVVEGLVEHERRVMECPTAERECLQNGLMFGTAIMKTGYGYQYGIQPPLADNRKLKGENKTGDGFEMDAVQEEEHLPKAAITEFDPRIMEGHPWQIAVSPYHFLIDPDAGTYEEARWVAHRFYRPLAMVRADSRYDRDARAKIGGAGTSSWYDETHDGTDIDVVEDCSILCLYEIYDKQRQRIIVLSDPGSEALMVTPYPFLLRDGPYTILQFIRRPEGDSSHRPRDFWAIPWADTFVVQIESYNATVDTMMEHHQRWGNTKAVYASGTMKDEEATRLAQSPGNELIKMMLQGPNQDINKLIKVLERVPINPDAWRLKDAVTRDMEVVSGVTEMQMGSGGGVATATQASYIQNQTGLRSTEMRDLFELFLGKGMKKVMLLLRQFWPAQKVVPIVGPDGQDWGPVTVTRDMVNAEFDVDIEPGSMESYDKAVRGRQAMDLINVLLPLAPLVQAQGHAINWLEIVIALMRTTSFMGNPERALIALPSSPPMQQMGPPTQGSEGGPVAQGGGANTPGPAPLGAGLRTQMPQQQPGGVSGRVMSEQMNPMGQRPGVAA